MTFFQVLCGRDALPLVRIVMGWHPGDQGDKLSPDGTWSFIGQGEEGAPFSSPRHPSTDPGQTPSWDSRLAPSRATPEKSTVPSGSSSFPQEPGFGHVGPGAVLGPAMILSKGEDRHSE